jgi:hypothetical protein
MLLDRVVESVGYLPLGHSVSVFLSSVT